MRKFYSVPQKPLFATYKPQFGRQKLPCNYVKMEFGGQKSIFTLMKRTFLHTQNHPARVQSGFWQDKRYFHIGTEGKSV